MNIEYRLPWRRGSAPRTFQLEPPNEPLGRPPRIARMVALAHKLEELMSSGQVSGHAELALLGRVSPARLSQILLLAQLAPAIQERILYMPPSEDGTVSERELREIAREVLWDRQLRLFKERLGKP